VLCATRAELRNDLTARGETWREDASNADLSIPRNRVRHELLPYLERHFNPSARLALARMSDALRAENALLERMAAAASAGLIDRGRESISVDVDALRLLPEAVQRRVIMHALSLSQTRTPSHADVNQVLDRMEHFGGKWVLIHNAPAPFSFVLPVPGDVRTDTGWIIQAEAVDRPQGDPPGADVAHIDAATVADGLMVRSRRPGDRIRPVGLGGTKKLQDVLVDRKVSRIDRDALPIVTDMHGRIVWVAGHVLGEEFRVTERTKGVIILKLRRI
jgi:tRNA(Ile)-lysidine synthase